MGLPAVQWSSQSRLVTQSNKNMSDANHPACCCMTNAIQLTFRHNLSSKAYTFHQTLVEGFIERKHPIHALMVFPDGWLFLTIFNGWLILQSIFTGSLPAGQGLLRAYELRGNMELMTIKAKM